LSLVTIQKDSSGELFIEIPEDMWLELSTLGWRIGDEIEFETEVKIINSTTRNREI
jgi:hypothetical protein